jgi:hypothetical protein
MLTRGPDLQKRSFAGTVTGYASTDCQTQLVITWNLDGNYGCLEQTPMTEMFSAQVSPDVGVDGTYDITFYTDGTCGTVATSGTYSSSQPCIPVTGGFNSADISLQ